ncbi:unnamed protein product [Prorocentrum cordatum]|uniref:Uncharacterized protein n=1 Tax=Prorocentrum cordatum TaxID=2364126 RepID=A0ABN9XLI8_9DINO|nr:unnamed protein product [Polarella glacialis]
MGAAQALCCEPARCAEEAPGRAPLAARKPKVRVAGDDDKALTQDPLPLLTAAEEGAFARALLDSCLAGIAELDDPPRDAAWADEPGRWPGSLDPGWGAPGGRPAPELLVHVEKASPEEDIGLRVLHSGVGIFVVTEAQPASASTFPPWDGEPGKLLSCRFDVGLVNKSCKTRDRYSAGPQLARALGARARRLAQACPGIDELDLSNVNEMEKPAEHVFNELQREPVEGVLVWTARWEAHERDLLSQLKAVGGSVTEVIAGSLRTCWYLHCLWLTPVARGKTTATAGGGYDFDKTCEALCTRCQMRALKELDGALERKDRRAGFYGEANENGLDGHDGDDRSELADIVADEDDAPMLDDADFKDPPEDCIYAECKQMGRNLQDARDLIRRLKAKGGPERNKSRGKPQPNETTSFALLELGGLVLLLDDIDGSSAILDCGATRRRSRFLVMDNDVLLLIGMVTAGPDHASALIGYGNSYLMKPKISNNISLPVLEDAERTPGHRRGDADLAAERPAEPPGSPGDRELQRPGGRERNGSSRTGGETHSLNFAQNYRPPVRKTQLAQEGEAKPPMASPPWSASAAVSWPCRTEVIYVRWRRLLIKVTKKLSDDRSSESFEMPGAVLNSHDLNILQQAIDQYDLDFKKEIGVDVNLLARHGRRDLLGAILKRCSNRLGRRDNREHGGILGGRAWAKHILRAGGGAAAGSVSLLAAGQDETELIYESTAEDEDQEMEDPP